MTICSLKEKEINSISIIPKEWQVAKLGDVTLKIDAGQTAPQGKDYFKNGKFPFIRVKHLNDLYQNKYIVNFDLINEKAISEWKLKLYPKGSIIFPKSGESIRLERRAILKKDSYVVNHLCIIIPNKERIDNDFIFYYLSHIKISELLTQTTTPSINLSQIREIKVSCPPLPEQRRIAEILSTVDEAIQKTDEIIQKAHELKRGLMQELLTKGIGHTKFKRTEIGEIPEEWEIKTVSKVCEKPQYGYTQSAKEQPVGPKFLRITDIQDWGVNWDKVPYCKCPDDLIDKYLLKPGDILFARTGATTGKSYIIKKCPKAVFASYLIRIRTKMGVNPDFLFSFFNSQFYWKQVKQNMVGSAQGGMNASLLSKLKVQLPPFAEQQKIASILSAVDGKIEKEKERKEHLEKLKKGLMQDLLTGRVRVKT